jgi:uncharacterized protein with HEPN domain
MKCCAAAVEDDWVCLGHIGDAIHDIEQYPVTGRDAFHARRMRQDAVIRKFEIIGEAVKQRSEETTQRRPDIHGDASPECATAS